MHVSGATRTRQLGGSSLREIDLYLRLRKACRPKGKDIRSKDMIGNTYFYGMRTPFLLDSNRDYNHDP